jgi:transposase
VTHARGVCDKKIAAAINARHAQKLVALGMTAADVARRMGVAPSTVASWLKPRPRTTIKAPTKPPSHANYEPREGAHGYRRDVSKPAA